MDQITYPLATSTWNDLEIKAIHRVIESNQYTMGKEVAAYEKVFADFLGSQHAVMCSSGSTANLLMVAALFYKKENALKAGDEVIVPAVSWSTTFFPLAQYGLRLKFVDIDVNTLNYDLEQLELAITDQTKLIMVVNLLGNPNDFSKIQDLAASRKIPIIEDNCESLGAKYQGKQAGTFGLMGTYSSFFSHHISTMEGGIVSTDDEELYHILLCLRAHGWTRNLPVKNHVTGTKSEDFFEESFKFVLPGYNVRPLEMSGAIGLEQMKKLPTFIDERRKNAKHFQELFKNHRDLLIQEEIGESSWFGFSLVIRRESKWTRKDIIQKLQAAKIDCRPIVAGNFAKNEALKWFAHEIHGELKNAEWIDQNGLFVGNHQHDIRKEINHLANILESR